MDEFGGKYRILLCYYSRGREGGELYGRRCECVDNV
jgi:hypothetical protein